MPLTIARLLQKDLWFDLAFEQFHRSRYHLTGKRAQAAGLMPDLQIRWPTNLADPDGIHNGLLDPLLHGLRELVDVELCSISQRFKHVTTIECICEGKTHQVIVDFWDHPHVNEEAAANAILYFKYQNVGGLNAHNNVVPGGYHPKRMDLYAFLPWLRGVRDRQQDLFEVYGRFGPDFAKDARRKNLSLLRDQGDFRFEGGLARIRYSRYLREIACSKICINLPGNGPLCFRLFDYLAVGACVISTPFFTELPAPLIDRKHIVFCAEDSSDLLELCNYYLNHDDERIAMQKASREYYDENVQPLKWAGYFLSKLQEHLTSS
ncbi:hypothetical protein BVY04_01325 [bacterium M21]|nr:hypothetical protein BVY04_01325 [bacterium M21]